MFQTKIHTPRLAAALLLAAGTAAAQTVAGGSLGVTVFDNVRLTLVNTAPTLPVTPACKVTAALADVTPVAAFATICPIGDCAVSSPPPPVALALAAGQAATIDYAPVMAPGVRQQLRPTFTFSPALSNALACVRLAATLELFDSATARTTILYPPVPFLPSLGPAGITAIDTIRLNVVFPPSPITPAKPCRVQASFFPLGTQPPVALATNTFTLTPGQSASLDFSGAGLAAGARQTVLPAVKRLSDDSTCPGLQSNFEIFDSASARTFAFFPPTPIFQ